MEFRRNAVRRIEEPLLMGLRVLVADDSTSMRKLVVRSLEAAGATAVTEAADGDAALAKFRPGRFDLVLTDWNMPGKSGLEVVEAIRARDGRVRIMMISTEAEPARVAQALSAGAADYLLKPFTAVTLCEKLLQHGV